MEIRSEDTEQGVTEQRFALRVDAENVPGIRWHPEAASGPRPTILIGHGGTQHKRVANVLGLARRFVRHLGYSAVALDAPGHGDRSPDPHAAERRRQAIEARIAERRKGIVNPIDPDEAKEWVDRTTKGISEWHGLLDALDAECEGAIYGYWGVSMGTAIGLPFVASEPRIKAAVLGLAGLGNRPGSERFERAARELSIPVLLVLQWGDELVSQRSGLALFDAIGSTEKTLHVNPGGHVQIPLFEREAYEEFFLRHLGPATPHQKPN
jgi:pimeloyl-ACP methyl ester carboxylesterase